MNTKKTLATLDNAMDLSSQIEVFSDSMRSGMILIMARLIRLEKPALTIEACKAQAARELAENRLHTS